MQSTQERPAQPAGAISRQLAAQERRREKAAVRVLKLREMASAEIDRLIAFLDASDPYASTELEEAVDDRPCDDDELEADYSDGREADDEPSLASPENHISLVWYYGAPPAGQWTDRSGDQTAWARGNDQDLEAEHDGREDPDEDHDMDCDEEPSLGSCSTINQTAWAAGGCDDREADHHV